MKTILVDAWNTLITPKGINQELFEFLQSLPNPKLILTNATKSEQFRFGISALPYPIFTCEHDPEKTDVAYFRKLVRQYKFPITDLIYFEHNELAVISARSLNILTYWYDKDKRDIEGVKQFLLSNLHT